MTVQSMTAVAVPLLASSTLLRVVGPPDYFFQGNLFFTLYGLAAGDRGWGQILYDHPRLYLITSDAARCRLAERLFWKLVLHDPKPFFWALVHSWRAAAVTPFAVLFDVRSLIPATALIFPGLAGAVISVYGLIRPRKQPGGFVLLALLATFACFPILKDAWPRVLASSIAFHGALAALGGATVVQAPIAYRARGRSSGADALARFGAVVAVVVLVAPVVVSWLRPETHALARPSCAAGEVPMAYRTARGSEVLIDDRSRPALTSSYLQTIQDPAVLPTGGAFRNVMDLLDPDDVAFNYVVVENPAAEPPPGQIAYACARLRVEGRWWQRTYSARVVPR